MYSYVIVGAGSAGCVLANRLSENPLNLVLLLEAGPRDWNPFIHIPGGMNTLLQRSWCYWLYKTAPQKHLNNRELIDRRGKVLGGSSSVNGMIYCRGAAEDYDTWQRLGASQWSYSDVLPYFKRAESHQLGGNAFHGDKGPLRVSRSVITNPLSKAWIDAAIQAGHLYNEDINGAQREGFGPADINVADGRRMSTATTYLNPIRKRPNLHIVTGARATRLLLEGSRAIGVEYVVNGRIETACAEAEIILSSGVFHSPQLLMLSGIGDADHLQEHGIKTRIDLKGVGQNLHDHLGFALQCQSPLPVSMARYSNPIFAAGAALQYLVSRQGVLATTPWEATGIVKSKVGDVSYPDIKMQLIPVVMMPGKRGISKLHGAMNRMSLTRPESRGRLTLHSADPFAAPRIDPNYLAEQSDLLRIRSAIKQARDIFAQPAYRPYHGKEVTPGDDLRTDAQIDMFIRASAEGDHHAVGTCRMGSDELAVVDSELRVRGVDGLRVVDASVMPQVVSGNTNAVCVMIAERAAEFIASKK